MALFVHAAAAISDLNHLENGEPEKLNSAEAHLAVEPNYSEWINAAMLRRMSRMIKMGVASALQCLTISGEIKIPDAIILGTGFGCFEDSEKFLIQMIQNKEMLLSPTPFIQSTHNTVAAQIALLIGCHGFNNTHVHGGLSFENALLDAMIYLGENKESDVLLGGADELTDNFIKLHKQAKAAHGILQSEKPMNLGEGAVFFRLNNLKKDAIFSVRDVKTFLNPSKLELEKQIGNFLNKNGINQSEISCIFSGEDIDKANPCLLRDALSQFPGSIKRINYKAYCGEFFTATAVAIFLAREYFLTSQNRYVLIINQYNQQQFSIILTENAKNPDS